MCNYNTVMETNSFTVVSEYEPVKRKSDSYQSEHDLEEALIKMLQEQGYERVSINNSEDLKKNLRKKLEELNDYNFTDNEWTSFYNNVIANNSEGIAEKTRTIQEDYIKEIKTEKGETKNIRLIDKDVVHNNRLQVINQYEANEGKYKNRYDVTILVNGLPLVHIELKRRGVPIKEAFNQIDRYQRESFWSEDGLFEFVQIFVISNGTNTKYYSNTTRESAIKEKNSEKKNSKKTSNSFEFTSYWADAKNNIINDLVDFTRTFFAKNTILNILTRYCVFNTQEVLLVMRPYQIAATEKILNRIEVSTNKKKLGSIESGGYIWHTTGSGKTLTSFKAAQLATKLNYIDKVLFVVDRKDLDYQTMKEYDKFQKGAANSNTSTRVLTKQLENPKAKIIITTIQKLTQFIKQNDKHEIYNKHIAIIFDECHRSHFGEMHRQITKHFNKYHMFGFTGTPIKAKNAVNKTNPNFCTTEQAFGEALHTYTVVNAINDNNVLPFRIDYVNTVNANVNTSDEQVKAIDTEEVLSSSERISKIVTYTLEHFDQKTKRNAWYDLKGKRINGFNSIFAVSSIPVLKKYYTEFKKQIKEKNQGLVVAIIFSFAPNEEKEIEGILDDEQIDTQNLDKSSREFLELAIADYNKTFNTNFSTNSDGFQNYYKDISERTKNREVDILLVVNMFLTGFDATTLNTLWVDKNLKYHGLIQAFSRTNRILNSVKSHGNIVCFRDLEKATEEAIALFGDENASGIVLLKTFDEYYEGYKDDKGKEVKGYKMLIEELQEKYPVGVRIIGEENEKKFIKLIGKILKVKNILNSFDDFEGKEILTEREFQDYTGMYVDLYQEYKSKKIEAESILDDVIFEIELVKQVEVNIDYILNLIVKYHESNCKDLDIKISIDKAINSSIALRSKKELINGFLDRINTDSTISDVHAGWYDYVDEQKENELEKIIEEENLNNKETRKFLENSFIGGEIKILGTDIDNVLPPIRRFSGNNNRKNIKDRVIQRLKEFFDKYFGIGKLSFVNKKRMEVNKIAEEEEKYNI